MSINSEIIRLNKKLKERSASIKRSFGDFILKDIIGERSVYNNLVNKFASIIAIENIEYENPNNNYFYKNKNLTFLTLNDEASKLFGNVGLFYLDGDSLSPERKITVYANTIDSMEGYFIPENALIYHNGKIWSYFKEEDYLFTRYEFSKFNIMNDGQLFVNEELKNINIVNSGAQVLFAEEFRTQIMQEDDD